MRKRVAGRSRRKSWALVAYGLGVMSFVQAQDSPSLHRWGQAVAYIPSPPSILLHGGKADPNDGFSYTSAPNSADTLLLPLSSSFLSSTSPFIALDAPDSPAYAWHTLTPFSRHDDGRWDLLAFGGDGGPAEAIQTRPDSAWYLTVDVAGHKGVWQRQASGWGNQPTRRIYHTAIGGGGKVYIAGGLRNDGSGQSHAEVYEFDPANGFSELATLPRATYHHGSVLLPNGTLITLGGVAVDMTTGMPAARSLSTITLLDTTDDSATWAEATTAGTVYPSPRRGMAAALTEDGKAIFVHGGASTTLNEVYADAWVLDLDSLVWRELGPAPASRTMARQDVASTPAGRYDHAAVIAPGGQVIILGGYGSDGVAEPGPFVFNLPDGTWQNQYSPSPVSNTPNAAGQSDIGPSAIRPTGDLQSSAEPLSAGQSNPSAFPGDKHTSGTTTPPASVPISGGSLTSAPSASASTSDKPNEDAETSGMGLPAQLGLIFGILAGVGLVMALFVCRYRRRRRRDQRLAKAIYGVAKLPERPYGRRDKGGEGLMEEARMDTEKATLPPPPPPTPPVKHGLGLGLGAVSAGLASLRGLVKKSAENDAYAVLHDEGTSNTVAGPAVAAGFPSRKSTRKVGNGIRLIGPRSAASRHEVKDLPNVPKIAGTRASIMSGSSSLRRDMLSDEDSRRFLPPGVEDWEVGDISRGRWRSAKSILADHAEDPFEDEVDGDDDDSLHAPGPVIRGGPVPTPHDSRTDLNPFDDPHFPRHERDLGDHAASHRRSDEGRADYGLPHFPSDPLLDLDSLLPPPATATSTNKRFSALSGYSDQPSPAMTDREEGVIQQARIVSPAQSEGAFATVRRTDTFFRRMAAGGISSLLSKSTSNSQSHARSQSSLTSLFDIRDPAPPPSLWPVVSRDMLMAGHTDGVAASTTTTKPPTAWKGPNLSLDLPSRPTHHPGPSLTSITSARSMRDMVIVQREHTASSGESATVEGGFMHDQASEDGIDHSSVEQDSAHGHRRQSQFIDTPASGSVVFDGKDFAMSPGSIVDDGEQSDSHRPAAVAVAMAQVAPASTQQPPSTPPRSIPSEAITPSTAASSTADMTSTPRNKPLAPTSTSSPIPQPLLSHRRPVSEMVKSINKRASANLSSATGSPASTSGAGAGAGIVSPASLYSTPGSPAKPSPTLSSPARRAGNGVNVKRPSTLYEAVKRDKLHVANPDGGG